MIGKEVIGINILKLKPACKNYLWGGRRLINEYGIDFDENVLAEAWLLSAHIDGISTVENCAGKNFRDYLNEHGLKVLGENCRRFKEFPILIKLIDAQDNLSVQVHPPDDYAKKFENQLGKHEMWLILDAAPDAFIYYGVNRAVTKAEFEEKIKRGTLLEILNKVHVKRGDNFFIPAGTIHSVGKGILLAEIQQSSNVSYRIFDYGRGRQLHIEKALDVANLKPVERDANKSPHLATCDYFTVDKINLNGKFTGTVDDKTFLSVIILNGNGKISAGDETFNFCKGDSYFIPADVGSWQLEGAGEILLTYVN